MAKLHYNRRVLAFHGTEELVLLRRLELRLGVLGTQLLQPGLGDQPIKDPLGFHRNAFLQNRNGTCRRGIFYVLGTVPVGDACELPQASKPGMIARLKALC